MAIKKKHSYQPLTILAIIMAVGLIAAAINYPRTPFQLRTYEFGEVPNGSILIAVRSDEYEYEHEYRLIAINPSNQKQLPLRSIKGSKSNYGVGGLYKKAFIYFNAEEKLASLDLVSGQETILQIPTSTDADYEEKIIDDFLIKDNILLYLQGCAQSDVCTFGKYDLQKNEGSVIVRGPKEGFTDEEPSHSSPVLYQYDASSRTALLANNSNDLGYSAVEIYAINIDSGQMRKLDSARSCPGSVGGEPTPPCPGPQWLTDQKNTYLKRGLFSTDEWCDNTHIISMGYDLDLVIIPHLFADLSEQQDKEGSIDQITRFKGKYVGCVQR